jgi:hypothetical protein
MRCSSNLMERRRCDAHVMGTNSSRTRNEGVVICCHT